MCVYVIYNVRSLHLCTTECLESIEMRIFLLVLCIACCFCSGVVFAGDDPDLLIQINLKRQHMEVMVRTVLDDGKESSTVSYETIHSWNVSTGRFHYGTPPGKYTPRGMDKNHHSSIYPKNRKRGKLGASMPYSIFFLPMYAIHGTNEVSRLGSPASHGCVRLSVSNAAKLFELVKNYGMSDTLIVIVRE